MRKIPITITLPEDLIKDLHLYIPNRGISKFVADALLNKIESEKSKFVKAFKEASKDKERNKSIQLWDELIGEGLDETNEY